MNKTELVEKIAAGAGLSKVDSKKALEATIAAIKDALVAGDKVALVGFGTFSVSERPARLVHSALASAPLVRVSTPLQSRRFRLLPRRWLSSSQVLSSLMLSNSKFVK